MKKLLSLLNIVLLSLGLISTGSCKSHKQAASNATQLEFNANEVWVLNAINGKRVKYLDGQKPATIVLNPEAGTCSGSNGCNRFFGNFKDFGQGKMLLSDISSTKMACPEAFHKLESSFMQLLRKCDAYTLDAYTLDLKQGDKVLLSFDKEQ